MSENLNELFQTAAKFFFYKYKENGGNLAMLAQRLGTSHTYISAVINGSRTASLELQNKIAKALYGPYDKFIAAGRRIMAGQKPDILETNGPGEDVESLIAHLTHYVLRQKELTQTVEEQKWLFESALDSIEEAGIVISDRNGTVLKWNRCYQKLLGYPDEVLATRNLNQYFHYLEDILAEPDDVSKVFEKINHSSEKITHLFTLKDSRTIKSTVYPIFRNGIPAGRIAHLIDVTGEFR